MSGPLTISGRASLIEGDIRITQRRIGPREVERTYTAVSAVARSAFDSIAADANEAVLQQHGALATITARYGDIDDDTEFFTATLSVRFNTVPFPINQNGYFAVLSKEQVAELDRLIEERKHFSFADPAIFPPGTMTEVPLTYYWLRRMSVDTFQAKLPIVNYTRTVSFDFPGSFQVGNVGRILTTQQVVSRTVGTDAIFNIPTPTIVFAENALGLFTTGWQLDAQLEYLADGSVQLIEQYEWGQWPTACHSFGVTK